MWSSGGLYGILKMKKKIVKNLAVVFWLECGKPKYIDRQSKVNPRYFKVGLYGFGCHKKL